MKAAFEFFGSRARDIDLTKETDLRDLVVFVSRKFPQLLDRIVKSRPLGPVEPYAFSVNGRYIAQDLSVRLSEGGKIQLFLNGRGG